MDSEMDEKKWTDGERDEAFDRGMETMQRVALELYRRGREPLLAELEEARKRNSDLRKMLEQVTRDRDHVEESLVRLETQRDEARAEVERQRELKDYLRTWLSSEELEGLRVKAAEHPLLCEEIHHWKAEVERLRREHDEMFAELRDLSKKYDECDAYKRGAEAMRKRCAMWIKHNSHEDGLGMGSQRIESALAALPIPEEP